MIAWPSAPCVAWARSGPTARYDLAASDLLPVTAAQWSVMLEADDRDRAGGAPSQEGTLGAATGAHFGVDAERVVVLTRPHNPTGALTETQTLQAIGAIAEEARIHLLVDEVYLDTAIGPARSAAALVAALDAVAPVETTRS